MNTIETPPQINNGKNRSQSRSPLQNLEAPQNADECLAQADAAFKSGNLAGACERLRQGLEQSPRNLPLTLCLGNIQFLMNDYAAAFRSFQSAVELDGHNAGVLVRLAISAAYCGETGIFEKTMAQVFKLEPENVDALRFLARLNLNEKEIRAGGATLSPHPQANPGRFGFAAPRGALSPWFEKPGRCRNKCSSWSCGWIAPMPMPRKS